VRATPQGIRLFTRPAAVVSGAAWTPASASSNGWYDVSDISTLFQDTAGTTPLTTDGQTCKRINDKSGNARDMIASNGTGWVYHANSGKPYLSMDGTESFRNSSFATLWVDGSGQVTMGAAVNFTTNTGTQDLFQGVNIYGPMLKNAVGAAVAAAYTAAGAGAGADNGPTITAATGIALTQITSVANLEAFVNGSGNGATANGTAPGSTADKMVIGGGCTGRFAAAAVFPSPLGTTDHASFASWLLAKF
jgi:hypothetical protein